MCGRYVLSSEPVRIGQEFDLDVRENFPPRYNIAPTQPIHVVALNEQRRRALKLMRWGFIPSWANKDYLERMGSKPLINARAETAAEKPTFRNAMKRRRCLVPADGFYEWKGAAGARTPYCIQRADGALFAFGGLWETAVDPDGGEIDTAAILTIAAGPGMAALHGREPVVIDRQNYALWLEADERDTGKVATLMAPRAEGYWRSYQVSAAVNKVRSDGAKLIEPATG